jgi:hypothetical protein
VQLLKIRGLFTTQLFKSGEELVRFLSFQGRIVEALDLVFLTNLLDE